MKIFLYRICYWITDLAEVAWMVLVEVDPVVVLATGVTPPSGVLPVLPDPANKDREKDRVKDRVRESPPSVSMRHVASQLPGLLLAGGHPSQAPL